MNEIKPQRGQPKKKPEDKKVPLTFSVRAKNRDRIKKKLAPIVQKMDLVNTKEEDYV